MRETPGGPPGRWAASPTASYPSAGEGRGPHPAPGRGWGWGVGAAAVLGLAPLRRKTLQLSRQLKEQAVEAQACYSLGNTYTLLQDHERAAEYHLRHLLIAQELADRCAGADPAGGSHHPQALAQADYSRPGLSPRPCSATDHQVTLSRAALPGPRPPSVPGPCRPLSGTRRDRVTLGQSRAVPLDTAACKFYLSCPVHRPFSLCKCQSRWRDSQTGDS